MCGGDHRWDVKTLSDPGVDLVHYDTPKRHSINYMLNRVDPHVGTHAARDPDGKHVELTVYRPGVAEEQARCVPTRVLHAQMLKPDIELHPVLRFSAENCHPT